MMQNPNATKFRLRAFWIVLVIVAGWAALNWWAGRTAENPLLREPLKPGYDVVLFITPNCRSCDRARQLLDQQSRRYWVYDLSQSQEALDKFEALGGLGAPMLVVGDQVLRGFNADAYQQALQRLDQP